MSTEKIIDREYESFVNHVIPFGSMDIREAVSTAIAVGKDGEWLSNIVEEFQEETNTTLSNIDVCYVVYEAILGIARENIENLTDHDFINDQDEITTYGNYCATAYSCSEEAKDSLSTVLKEKHVQREDLDEVTIWFLEDLEIEF